MSEAYSYPNRLVTSSDAWRPDIDENMIETARELGFPDVCDGVNNIGNYDIRTPREDRVCNTTYTADLMYHAQEKLALPDQLIDIMDVKFACHALSARELAVLLFNYGGTAIIREQAVPAFMQSPTLLSGVIRRAEEFGYIDNQTTVQSKGPDTQACKAALKVDRVTYRAKAEAPTKELAQREAYLKAISRYLALTLPDEAEAPHMAPLAPAVALDQYVHEYGGQRFRNWEDADGARQAIRTVYEHEFQDQLFYEDPISALIRIFRPVRLEWHEQKNGNYSRCGGVTISPSIDGGNARRYATYAYGPNPTAARRATARLILKDIGATDPAILER